MHHSSGIVLAPFNNLVKLHEVAAIASLGACGGHERVLIRLPFQGLGDLRTVADELTEKAQGLDKDQLKKSIYMLRYYQQADVACVRTDLPAWSVRG
jgi:hypothetical protein